MVRVRIVSLACIPTVVARKEKNKISAARRKTCFLIELGQRRKKRETITFGVLFTRTSL